MSENTKRHSSWRWLAISLLGFAAIALGGGVVILLQRQAIGVRLAQDYLRAQGVPAVVRLGHLGLGGATGSLRLGPADRPDLIAPDVRITFDPWPASRHPFAAPQVRSIRLVNPTLRVEWRDNRLRFGALQRLIDSAGKAKPSGAPPPDLDIRRGTLILRTDAGELSIALDGAMKKGRLIGLSARLKPTQLASASGRFASLTGEATVRREGLDRLRLVANASAARVETPDGVMLAPKLTINGSAPDPTGPATDGALRRIELALHLQAPLLETAARRRPPIKARAIDLSGWMGGAVDRRNAFLGSAKVSGAAGLVQSRAGQIEGAKLELASRKLELCTDRPSITGAFVLALSTAGGRVLTPIGPAALEPARLYAQGRLQTGERLHLDAAGAIDVGAGFSPAVAEARIRRLVIGAGGAANAMAEALRSAHLQAPAFNLTLDGDGSTLQLAQAVTLKLATGEVTLRPLGRSTTLQSFVGGDVGAAFGFTARVRQAPQLDLVVERARLSRTGALEAAVDLTAQGDLSSVHGGAVHLRGAISGQGRSWTLRADDCVQANARSIAAADGKVLAEDVRGELCPSQGAPLFASGDQGWRAKMRLRDAAFTLPEASLEGRMVAADVSASASGRTLAARARLDQARLIDISPARRFGSLDLEGAMQIAGGQAQGRIDMALAGKGRAIGQVNLDADLAAGKGRVSFDSGPLLFDPKGLQPGDIAPPLAALMSEATGPLKLQAQADWFGKAITGSSGVLITDGLAFKSPAGRIEGVRGQVRLVSLLPLQSAPRQALSADRLATVLPLTGLNAAFTLVPGWIDLDSASAQAAGGALSLDAMRLPMDGALSGITGVLRLKGVDLQKVIGVVNLADSVAIDARVSGELPFSITQASSGAAVVPRLDHGRLHADGPGRLSIQRKALGAAVATADGTGAQPNAVQDFAYQALENLAFTRLEADVASRPGGRLGAVLHVTGSHDPVLDRPTRIGIFELLGGHAFDKPLPLPKGTPIDLTLDTSLNLDDLLAQYGAINAPLGSAKVKP